MWTIETESRPTGYRIRYLFTPTEFYLDSYHSVNTLFQYMFRRIVLVGNLSLAREICSGTVYSRDPGAVWVFKALTRSMETRLHLG